MYVDAMEKSKPECYASFKVSGVDAIYVKGGKASSRQ